MGGRIYPGSHGLAGELGHIPVSLDGPACWCGATGCLTTYTHAVLDAAGLGVLVSPHDTSAALTESATACTARVPSPWPPWTALDTPWRRIPQLAALAEAGHRRPPQPAPNGPPDRARSTLP
ncbi:ROK family protein [Streptomyces sp. FXJ1.172]|uniref:ROK family protein n=1 Tax=Streptomyces sp. FXJ1.172 TaxID=710705 RepID=UPI000AA65B79|nr:ROK family protein [Streptomyces sp. FXJ1.172]WEO94783.1 ROK family protein [Streptomyces sp. FXJ1.172]